MPELDPSDATLLAIDRDSATGVSYIPTGQTPYFLEFRRMLYRLLRATERANDLRVYADGPLSVGVRGGRCFIDDQALVLAAQESIAVNPSTTTHLWIDNAGLITSGEAGLPSDRTMIVALAEITTDASSIQSITDLRGESMLQVPPTSLPGLTASTSEINQALDGISSDVTATALSDLTAGDQSSANTYHTHSRFNYDFDGLTTLRVSNQSSGSSATVGLELSLTEHLADHNLLEPDPSTGFLRQSYDGTTHYLVGSVHVQAVHRGALTADELGIVMGTAPITGNVTDVILSIGSNMLSTTPSDNVTAIVSVNGTTVTTTHPALMSSDGQNHASTDQGKGTAAVVKSDGTENVSRGDVFTLDLDRTAVGTVFVESADISVLVVIQPDRPE